MTKQTLLFFTKQAYGLTNLQISIYSNKHADYNNIQTNILCHTLYLGYLVRKNARTFVLLFFIGKKKHWQMKGQENQ